jgi:hypothetical protein
LKLKCPGCGASYSLDVLIANQAARELVLMALKLPAPLGKRLIDYVALHRPEKRDLSFDRVAAILGELAPLIEAAQITWEKRVYAAPLPSWEKALQTLIDKRDSGKLNLPLKGNGLLLSIIASQAERAEAKAETAVEEQRRHAPGGRRSGIRDAATAAAQISAMRSATGIKRGT